MVIVNYSGQALKMPNSTAIHRLPAFTAFQLIMDGSTVIRRGILCMSSASSTSENLFWMQGVSRHRVRGESQDYVSLFERIPDGYIQRLTFVRIPPEVFIDWLKTVPASVRACCEHPPPKRQRGVALDKAEDESESSPFLSTQSVVPSKQLKEDRHTKKNKTSIKQSLTPRLSSTPATATSTVVPAWQCTSPPSSLDRDDSELTPDTRCRHISTVQRLQLAVDTLESTSKDVASKLEKRIAKLEHRLNTCVEKMNSDIAEVDVKISDLDKEFSDHVAILVQKGFY